MRDIAAVRELEFSDLYVGHPVLPDRLTGVPGADSSPLVASPVLQEDIDRLVMACQASFSAAHGQQRFKLEYDGVSYLAAAMATQDGHVFLLRKITAHISLLSELGIPQAYIRCLLTRNMSGLFLVSGKARSGKTTSACAMLKERLVAFGGIAISVEEVAELPLGGHHGSGVCYQMVAARSGTSPTEMFRQAMRWGAKMIFVDEINDSAMAAEVLQASVNGSLIVSTMQASSIVRTINKLQSLANEKLAPASVQALMADGLCGILCQTLGLPQHTKLGTELFLSNECNVIRNMLRNGDYELLGSEIQRQMSSIIAAKPATRLMMGGINVE
ncbi:ATPase, T2SS/T4P/T4SS family [Undibacterium sp. TS12]|uniref:ATPase, T2SS/T4P/T4SS family n=1 Tax=Undibacterium sp. TS12 TaxID=2908202 RepID=UPI001F4D09D6|nr:ATPase, T2SS/T4P/T4SS family [Undibacterium sp. TS12]MCH8621972.1 Flp pilus assembly complex ATPase component TadA [Undibacterium sp. TS12]